MTDLTNLNNLQAVTAFGGGHGLGRLLASLSFMGDRLVGVVATTDDGGSTGRLREQAGCIAWGDLRNCLNQLTRTPTLGRLLFEHRFYDAGELTNHNLGNLMLLALDQLSARPLDAVNLVREFLHVRPRLIPMSEEYATLNALDDQGREFFGEVAVADMQRLPIKLWLEPSVPSTPEAVQAVEESELILLGPGSYITSCLPSLLTPETKQALMNSSAPRVLIANLGAEPGPIGELPMEKQIDWTHRMLDADVVDYVLWPSSRPCPSLSETQSGKKIVCVDVLESDGSFMHDRAKLAQGLEELLKVHNNT